MKDFETKAVQQRLRSIQGHVGGVVRMAERDASCVDLLWQIQAVQCALSKVTGLILAHHIDTCLTVDVGDRGRAVGESREIVEAMQGTARTPEPS